MDELKEKYFDEMLRIDDLQSDLHFEIEKTIIKYIKESGMSIVTLSETVNCKNREENDDKEVFTVNKVGLNGDYLEVHCIYNGKDSWIDSAIIYTEDLISIFKFMLNS